MKKAAGIGLAVVVLALTGCQVFSGGEKGTDGGGDAVLSGSIEGSGSGRDEGGSGATGRDEGGSGAAGGDEGGSGTGTESGGSKDPKEEVTMEVRLVDGGGSDSLLLAGTARGEVYSVYAGDEVSVYLDDKLADISVLEDGMMLSVFLTMCWKPIPHSWEG